MKYAYIDKNGQLLGWYDDEIHTSIPTPNIEVSDEAWQNAINNNHNKVNADGTTEAYDFRTDDEKKQSLKKEFTQSIQTMLDEKANEKGYDNIASACSYAGYDNPFRAEGEAYGLWRALCWSKAYAILEAVETGMRPMPTISEVLEEMPVLEIR